MDTVWVKGDNMCEWFGLTVFKRIADVFTDTPDHVCWWGSAPKAMKDKINGVFRQAVWNRDSRSIMATC